ncbi:MAG: ParB/RepB/Spo0J family partition protein [Clostridia bacterium]|nr:ParB/RepB/Spo0J family partition protein [Clostridia bacterium]
MPYSFQQGLLEIPPKRDPDRRLVLLPTRLILPNPSQPRQTFDRDALSDLMVSIAQVGLIQPLTVRRKGDGYELISGERRLRACRALGMAEVPCILTETNEETSAYMALVENIQRSDLHFLDEAESYHNLLHAYGLSQEQLATRLGKSPSFLSNKLRLLRLSKPMRDRIRAANLSERHARALLQLSDEETQWRALETVVRDELNVKQTEQLVARMKERQKRAPLRVVRLPADCRLFLNGVKTLLDRLTESGLKTSMEEQRRGDGFDLVIHVRLKEPTLF